MLKLESKVLTSVNEGIMLDAMTGSPTGQVCDSQVEEVGRESKCRDRLSERLQSPRRPIPNSASHRGESMIDENRYAQQT